MSRVAPELVLRERPLDQDATGQWRTGQWRHGGRAATRRLTILGAPQDLGSGGNGSAGGPEALRAAGLAAALQQRFRVLDGGDVPGIVNQPGRTRDRCHHLEQVAGNCARVRDAVEAVLEAGAVPLLVGGDHSLAIGSLAAVRGHCVIAGKPLHVLWLDAHADFNTPESSDSGLIYGMPVAVSAGDGHAALTAVGAGAPPLSMANVTMIGVRSIDSREAVRLKEQGVRVHGMDEVRARGVDALVGEAVAHAQRAGAHLHVSFDVDFLDPAVAPGVGLAEPDGPDWDQAMACMAALAQARIDSFDLVELNPVADPSGVTAARVMRLVALALGRG